MTNSQRVAVEVKESTAKLIMGTLTDVGVSFDYQRVQGQTLTARVSVAARNGQTLLKVRDVVQDRQNRAQPSALAASYEKMMAERENKPPVLSKTYDQSGMPPGFTAHFDRQLGYWWYSEQSGCTGRTYKTLEACQKHALEKYQATQADV